MVIAGGEVGLVGEDGACVFGATTANEGRGQLDFKVDDEGIGCGEQQGAGVGSFDGATAEGQDDGIDFGKAGDGGMFAVAKGGFPMTGKDFGDGCVGFGFDYVVDIDEFPAKTACDEWADGSLA